MTCSMMLLQFLTETPKLSQGQVEIEAREKLEIEKAKINAKEEIQIREIDNRRKHRKMGLI